MVQKSVPRFAKSAATLSLRCTRDHAIAAIVKKATTTIPGAMSAWSVTMTLRNVDR